MGCNKGTAGSEQIGSDGFDDLLCSVVVEQWTIEAVVIHKNTDAHTNWTGCGYYWYYGELFRRFWTYVQYQHCGVYSNRVSGKFFCGSQLDRLSFLLTSIPIVHLSVSNRFSYNFWVFYFRGPTRPWLFLLLTKFFLANLNLSSHFKSKLKNTIFRLR